MRDMTELGFLPAKGFGTLVVDLDGTRVPLPDEYVSFQSFRPPASLELGFAFINAEGEQWEGQVVEFMKYKQETINQRVVRPSKYDLPLLPIAVDAGGNYLFLVLCRNPMPVVELNYSSGLLSTVANSFGEFLDRLYQVES
jgi:hypothetical protein